MSASSTPTLAPERLSPAARFTATVDLPTPPLPDATAIVCLIPGIAMPWGPAANDTGTLAVILSSTAVTPGRDSTISWAIVWKRSRTGQAGVVSSKVKLTRPSAATTRSLIIPRLTTSRPRSGSWIAESACRIWSVLGDDIRRPSELGAENDCRAQSQHSHQDDHPDQGRIWNGAPSQLLAVGACPVSGLRPDQVEH